jgi:hypothetical protein
VSDGRVRTPELRPEPGPAHFDGCLAANEKPWFLADSTDPLFEPDRFALVFSFLLG